MSSSPRLTCLTGAGQTGANAYLLEVGAWRLLFDAGASSSSWRSWLPHLEQAPDVVWISHVHADHIGALSALRQRSSCEVLMTPASVKLLPAALRHQDHRHARSSGEALAALVHPLDMYQTREVRLNDSILVRLTPYPCGHMLGAASLALEVVWAGKFHRILYLPDFSAHALPLTPRAAFPIYDEDTRLDVLIMEGMLGADRAADALDFEVNLSELVTRVASDPRPAGQVLALGALGDSCEIAWALSRDERLSGKLIIHDYLRPVFLAYASALPALDADMMTYATQTECEALLRTGHVVIAPGEHLDEGTPAHHLAMRVHEDRAARIVLLNGIRKKSVAGRLWRTHQQRGEGERSTAEIMHVLLPTHAPRWALKGVLKALKPRHTWLVHGQRGSLTALAKACRVQQHGRGWAGEISVPESGDVLELT